MVKAKYVNARASAARIDHNRVNDVVAATAGATASTTESDQAAQVVYGQHEDNHEADGH